MSNIQPYIILNGTDSRSISGLLISSLPPISKPQVRTQIETVDGRDGDIVTPLGFSAYDKVINIGLTYNYDVDEIIEFFNSEGIVTFSNEPDKYYRYAIYEQIDFDKLIRFKTAEVTLHVQPFKFSTTEEPELFNVVSGQAIAVTNEGNTDSRPNLTIIGSGDIDVSLNGSQILSIELEDDQAVIIDSEDMNAYAAQSAIREVVADIDPVQDLHGYSKPWSGGGGKNKANKANDLPSGSGITVTVANDGTLTINGTSTVTCYIRGYFNCPDSTATYTWALFNNKAFESGVEFSVRTSDNSSAGGWARVNATIKTFSFTPSAVPTKWQFQISSGITFNNAVFKPMIVSGNTAPTDYEPYSNICPISGFSALNVTRTGKNKLNYNAWKTTTAYNGTAVFENNGVTLTATANDCYTLTNVNASVPISEGEAITLSWEETSNKSGLIFIFPNGTTTGMVTVNNGAVKKVTYTATSGITFITFRFGVTYSGDTIAYKNIQIEKGNQATDFEPYNGQTYNIPFDQTVYGGSLNVTTGELTVTHEYCIFNGTETITSNQQGGHTRFSCQKLVNLADNNASNENFCSHFIASSSPIGQNQTDNAIGVYNRGLYWRADQFTDITAMKNYLLAQYNANTPIMYVAKLATPIELQLTPTQINNLLGVNNMYSDTGDITVKHKSNGVIVTDTGDIVSFYAGLDDIEKGVLLNRAITGDYDKIRLRKGVNTFVLSGNARQFAIDKYSRWI